MKSNETQIRVRYAETDTMGILHHAVYPVYFEEGRTELMRSLGMSYDEMEKKGVILPVYSINVQYLRPAYYDDLLTLRTEVAELKGVKITFDYKLFNNNSILLATGNVTLVFTNPDTFKPVRPPAWFLSLMQ
ncbi:MAG: thioesterase family protein [Bacteroidales bacterium]|nr:thioesterase family protein [Bacteroidales bacterium]